MLYRIAAAAHAAPTMVTRSATANFTPDRRAIVAAHHTGYNECFGSSEYRRSHVLFLLGIVIYLYLSLFLSLGILSSFAKDEFIWAYSWILEIFIFDVSHAFLIGNDSHLTEC